MIALAELLYLCLANLSGCYEHFLDFASTFTDRLLQRLTVLSSLAARDKKGAIISYLFAFLLYSPPLASSPVDINRRWLLALKGITGEAGGVCCCPGSDSS